MDQHLAVRCLVMPLDSQFALLPSVLVEALLYNEYVSPAGPDAPNWLLGSVRREALGAVPIVSLDCLCGYTDTPVEQGQLALLKHVTPDHEVVHVAVLLAAAPWVVEIDNASMLMTGEQRSELECVASQFKFDGRDGIVPDLDELAALLKALPSSALTEI